MRLIIPTEKTNNQRRSNFSPTKRNSLTRDFHQNENSAEE